MTSQIGFTTFEALPPGGRVHIVGAGPVGLLLAALLQSVPDVDVRLYEKRDAYTRGRMVQLEPFLVADSVESYCDRPDRRRQRRGGLRSVRAERGHRVPAVDSVGSDEAAARLDAGLLPAQGHRAVPERSDRRTRVEVRAAGVGSRDRTGRDRDARARRHADRLHREQIAASRPPRARLRRGGERREHATHPASSTRSWSRSSTASRTTATSIASTTRTSGTSTTSSSRRCIARTRTATSLT